MPVTSLLTNTIDTWALKHSLPVTCLHMALHHQLSLLGKADRTMLLRQYAVRKAVSLRLTVNSIYSA